MFIFGGNLWIWISCWYDVIVRYFVDIMIDDACSFFSNKGFFEFYLG